MRSTSHLISNIRIHVLWYQIEFNKSCVVKFKYKIARHTKFNDYKYRKCNIYAINENIVRNCLPAWTYPRILLLQYFGNTSNQGIIHLPHAKLLFLVRPWLYTQLSFFVLFFYLFIFLLYRLGFSNVLALSITEVTFLSKCSFSAVKLILVILLFI